MLLPLSAFLFMAAASAGEARVELPIRLVQEPGRAPRYAVTIMINDKPVEVALDTGSVGLRVIAPSLPDGARDTGRTVTIGFNSGVMLEGAAVQLRVKFGDVPAQKVLAQRIDRADCRPGVPRCEATGVALSDYRIMSDGKPGSGFVGILGIGLRPEALGHPLEQSGIDRWIVQLPRNAGETGRLILNPAEPETAGYRYVPFLPGRNEVAGCLVTPAKRLCAPAMVDSGAPGITLFGASDDDVPEPATEASLQLGDGADAPTMPITVGQRDQGASIRARPRRPDAPTSLSFGIAPYLRWSILYDARGRRLGVLDR